MNRTFAMTVERVPRRPGVKRVTLRTRVADVLGSRHSVRDAVWDRELHRERAADIETSWRLACEGISALSVRTNTPTGVTVGTPKVLISDIGPPVILAVQLRPGQVPEDITKNATRLAAAVGARTLRVTGSRGHGWCVVELVHGADPLLMPLTPADLPPWGGVVLGRGEDGASVTGDVTTWPHWLLQGSTTAGKSSLLRWVLVQLAGREDVQLVGSDPSGSLWRPWPAHPRRVTGLADVRAHLRALENEVFEMDARLADLRPDADRVSTSAEVPLRVVVLEEFAGLLRAADVLDKDIGMRVRLAVGRLLAEGHKAGVRVLVLVQRADAKVVGGFDRSNLGMAISFRTDREGVLMVHPGASAEIVDAHVSAPPGVALLTAPGLPLTRFRAPWLTYPDYARMVADRA
jgi:hypothetical protein